MAEIQNIQQKTTSDFLEWITALKTKIRSARNKLAFSINSQVLELYWEIGKDISEKQQNSGWGSGLIEQIAEELKHDFPEIKGFSRRNIYAILQWYKFYSEKYPLVPQVVAQIPWGHNRLIITKIKDVEEAEFYCRAVIQNAWDRDTLEIQIESNYYLTAGNSTHNFSNTLPAKQSELAIQTLKDPYNFDFAGLANDALEAVDSQLRKSGDNPTIGILLCKKKNKIDVEYALRDIHKPMGISEYILTNAIPEDIKPQLPSVEELERELEKKQLEKE
jgi:predicted nuclease of restriction endonuclease-like (RecB) superfamily